MRRLIYISLLVALMLSACSAAAADQLATDEQGSTLVTVYRAPT